MRPSFAACWCGWLLGALAAAAAACGSGTATPAAGGPVVTISLVDGGADAAALERSAVEPVEAAVSRLGGVRALRSTIEPGRALVAVTFEPARPLELAAGDVRRAIDGALRQLPAELEPPVISIAAPGEPALRLEISSPQHTRAMLSDLAREVIRTRLERLPGTGAIELDGAVEREIVVRPDLARLAAVDLAPAELATAIQGAMISLPAGRLAPSATPPAVALRVTAAPMTLEGLAELVIATRGDAPIRLRDVAMIAEETAGDATRPLSLSLRLQQGARREEVLARVRAAIADLRGELPPGITLAPMEPPPDERRQASLSVSLRGPDRAELRKISAKLEADLRATAGIAEVVRAPPPEQPTQTIDIDRDRAARLGVASAQVASTLRAVLGGASVGTLREGPREHEIVLRIAGDSPELLARLTVRAGRGGLVPLSEVATLRLTASEHLLRLDRERAIELSARVATGASAAAIRRRLAELTRDLPLPPGYRAVIAPAPPPPSPPDPDRDLPSRPGR